MVPLIRSRQLVGVAPVDPARVEVGDIVLARVAGTVYLHLVSAVDPGAGRVQISNNRGRVNGWTSHARVFGICTHVDGMRRPRIEGKLRAGQVSIPPGAVRRGGDTDRTERVQENADAPDRAGRGTERRIQ
jgi:hypothetical protein